VGAADVGSRAPLRAPERSSPRRRAQDACLAGYPTVWPRSRTLSPVAVSASLRGGAYAALAGVSACDRAISSASARKSSSTAGGTSPGSTFALHGQQRRAKVRAPRSRRLQTLSGWPSCGPDGTLTLTQERRQNSGLTTPCRQKMADASLCPSCGRAVPPANMLLHQARCTGSRVPADEGLRERKRASPRGAGDQRAPFAMREAPDVDVAPAGDSPRFAPPSPPPPYSAAQPAPTAPRAAADWLPDRAPPPYAAGHADEGWACPRCTFHNAADAVICEVCGDADSLDGHHDAGDAGWQWPAIAVHWRADRAYKAAQRPPQRLPVPLLRPSPPRRARTRPHSRVRKTSSTRSGCAPSATARHSGRSARCATHSRVRSPGTGCARARWITCVRQNTRTSLTTAAMMAWWKVRILPAPPPLPPPCAGAGAGVL
jgi:hypothetical protein